MPLVRVLTAAFLLTASAIGLNAQRAVDPLTAARQAYNDQQYDRAIALAKEARATPALADSASLVLSRAMVERFRRTADIFVGVGARSALLSVNPARLTAT
jgi:hypothetical protein